MNKKRPADIRIMFSMLFLFFLLVLTGSVWGQEIKKFSKDPVIGGPLLEKAKQKQKQKTQNAPKIILKRDIEGRYSWVVEGTDVSQVIREDIKLRHYIDRAGNKEK